MCCLLIVSSAGPSAGGAPAIPRRPGQGEPEWERYHPERPPLRPAAIVQGQW